MIFIWYFYDSINLQLNLLEIELQSGLIRRPSPNIDMLVIEVANDFILMKSISTLNLLLALAAKALFCLVVIACAV